MHNDKHMTAEEFLLDKRVIFVSAPISQEVGSAIILKLIFLESQKPGQNISLYLTSPYGDEISVMAVIDTIQHITSKVEVYASGLVGGSSTLLLAAGCKGSRYALPSSVIHMKQPAGAAGGTEMDIQILTDQAIKIKTAINTRFSEFTGKDIKEIEKTMDRDRFFTAQEALEFGLIDKIAVPKKKK